jgi:hypothetical protein
MKRKVLKALSLAANLAEPLRTPLKCLIIHEGESGTIFSATDGHIAARLRVDASPMPERAWMLPFEALQPHFGTKRQAEDSISLDYCTLTLPGQKVELEVVDYPVPKFENLLKNTPAPSQYDPRLLARLYACVDALGGEDFWLTPMGPNPGRVTCNLDFVGLIMPWRQSEPELPRWI